MERIISLVDLLHFEESKKMIQENDTTEFEKLLFNIGFDIKQDIEYQLCIHRPMAYVSANKNPVFSARWIGTERRDKEWIDSENCTNGNKLEMIGMKDLGLQRELVRMGQLPNFTQMACEHVRDNTAGGWE